MSKKIILIGAGENAQVIKNVFSTQPQYEVLGCLDDVKKSKDVIGKVSSFRDYISKASFFITICNNSLRKKIFDMLKAEGAQFVNAIHNKAHLEPGVYLGENVFVGAIAYININSKISDGCMINNCCVIEHDNEIGEHCHLTPGVVTGGGVKIGRGAFVGLGTRINDHVTIGSKSVIGSGSVVIKDIEANVTAVGIPANVIKNNKV